MATRHNYIAYRRPERAGKVHWKYHNGLLHLLSSPSAGYVGANGVFSFATL